MAEEASLIDALNFNVDDENAPQDNDEKKSAADAPAASGSVAVPAEADAEIPGDGYAVPEQREDS